MYVKHTSSQALTRRTVLKSTNNLIVLNEMHFVSLRVPFLLKLLYKLLVSFSFLGGPIRANLDRSITFNFSQFSSILQDLDHVSCATQRKLDGSDRVFSYNPYPFTVLNDRLLHKLAQHSLNSTDKVLSIVRFLLKSVDNNISTSFLLLCYFLYSCMQLLGARAVEQLLVTAFE